MYAPITGVGDGSEPVVNLTFDYLDQAHVKAEADGVEVTFTWTGASQITFDDTVAADVEWSVYRETPITLPMVDFMDSSVLTEEDLDTAHAQLRYHQEEIDATFGGLDADIVGNLARSLRTPDGETLSELDDAAARANRYLLFDGDGNPSLSQGTGTDTGLRDDLFASTGLALVGAQHSGYLDTSATTLQAVLERSINVEDFGVSVSNTAAANTTAMHLLRDRVGGGDQPVAVLIPPKVYPMEALSFEVGNLYFIGYGATFEGPTASLVTSPEAPGIGLFGLKIVRTDGGENPVLHLNGKNSMVRDVWIEKSPDGPGYMMMIEADTDLLGNPNGFVSIDGLVVRGGNGIFVEGIGHRLTNLDGIARAVGGDDFIVFKARGTATRGIVVDNVRAEGYSNAIAFGSEIGSLGVDATTRPGRVQNVSATNVIARGASFLFFFKPGAIDNGASYDWRYGLVDTVHVQGQIEDNDGDLMERPVVVSASRAAKISNLTIVVKAVGRSKTGVTGRSSVFDIYIPDYSAAVPPAAPPTITKVHGELTFEDPYDAVANGVGGAPGDPFEHIFSVAKQAPGHGTISKITAKVRGNGSDLSGIYVADGLDDAVELQEVRLSNVNRTGGATFHGGVFTNSRLTITDRAASIEALTGSPYHMGATGDIIAEKDGVLYANQINAGNAETQYPWSPRRRGMLLKVQMVVNTAIAQNDTNYTEFEMRNIGGSGNVFHSPKTKVTDGGEAAPAINLAAGTVVTLLNEKNLTDPTNRGQLLFDQDELLFMRKQEGGTGATLLGARAWFHWAPY